MHYKCLISIYLRHKSSGCKTTHQYITLHNILLNISCIIRANDALNSQLFLENAFSRRLTTLLTYHNVSYNSQDAFRENHSTVLASTEMMEEIASSLDSPPPYSGRFTCGICINLNKAVDTIDHPILLLQL